MLKKKARMLSVSARNTCKGIAQLKAGLASKRALALLAVDEGTSQSMVAKEVGLTVGQVKYAVALFRKKKLTFFPADLLAKKALTAPKATQAKVSKINLKEIENVAKDKKKEKKQKKSDEKKKAEKKVKKPAAVKAKAKKKDKKSDKKKTKKAENKSKKSSKGKSSKKKDKGKKSKKK